MNRSMRLALTLASITGAIGTLGAAYSLGAMNARTEIARAQVPINAVRVWTGRVMVPGGKRVHGTVYEVADPTGRPLARYTVEAGNPVPHVVRF